MEDYRLEQQKNTAANILSRAPLLNLYAHKHSLSPALARFRLLQVLSQSPEEADPSHHPSSPEPNQGAAPPFQGPQPQPQPEVQPQQPQPAAEAQQGPQPQPRRIGRVVVLDAEDDAFLSDGSTDTSAERPSDLEPDSEEEPVAAAGVAQQHPRARGAPRAELREQGDLNHQPQLQQPEQEQEEHQQQVAQEEGQKVEEEAFLSDDAQ